MGVDGRTQGRYSSRRYGLIVGGHAVEDGIDSDIHAFVYSPPICIQSLGGNGLCWQ